MFDDFTTIGYLLSFPGMIAAVIMLTQFTKKMWDNVGVNHTKFIVLGYSLVFCVLAAMLNGSFVSPSVIAQTVLVWTVNAVIIWFASMKAFETIAEPASQTVGIDVRKGADTEAYKEAFDLAIELLDKSKIVKLKSNTNM